MKNNQKILLIDGNFLMYQSFFATYYSANKNSTYLMQNGDGVLTNGINHFLLMLFNLIEEVKPTHLFVSFDPKVKTFRHKLLDSYKAGRQKSPVEIYEQFSILKKLLDELNVPHNEIDGYEGDDLIASLAHNLEIPSIIYSKDKDLLQLVNHKTSIIFKNSKLNEYYFVTEDNFYDTYGILPSQIVDYKGLAGDSSDNLIGVKGIGDKTAIKLLNKYKNFENIYTNLTNLTPSMQKKFIEGKESGLLSKKLAQLIFDIPELNLELNKYELNLNKNCPLIDELELARVKNKLREL